MREKRVSFIDALKGKMETETKIYYLKRLQLYKEEKPYMLTFELPEDVGESTNHVYEEVKIKATDAHPNIGQFSLDVNGFQFETWPTDLLPADFDNDDIIKSRYYPQLISRIREAFPNVIDVMPIGHTVSVFRSGYPCWEEWGWFLPIDNRM